jgi:hypothetical protein
VIVRRCLLGVAVLAAIGCSDTTSPASSTARQLDALYQRACARSFAGDTNYTVRCEVLSNLVAVPASGAEPSPLQIVTAGGTLGWRGVVVEFTDTSFGFTGGPRYTLIAYSDANATNIVFSQYVPGSETSPYLLVNDTVLANATSGGAAGVGQPSSGSRCVDTPGLANPLGGGEGNATIDYGGSSCRVATFPVSLNTMFFTVTGADSGFASIYIPTQTVNGILVSD